LTGDEGDNLDLKPNGPTVKDRISPKIAMERQKALEEFERLQHGWRAVATDDSPTGKSRRADLARQIRGFDLARIHGPEVYVDIDIPPDHQGFSFYINDKEFAPGHHRVTAGEAQVLLHMIDANRRAGLRVFQTRGQNVNLGTIGDMARAAAIQGED
jgi:hypothetical protein